MPLTIVRNDITRMKTDAIVNAANARLKAGGGVDGAVHAAAGPLLQKELDRIGSCAPGSAVVTESYGLGLRCIIHTVGPVWQGGNDREEETLRSCYRSSLQAAVERGCASVAFPLISAGIFGYPRREAFRIAAEEIRAFLSGLPDDEPDVYLVLFTRDDLELDPGIGPQIESFIDDRYVDEYQLRPEQQRRRQNRLYGSIFKPDSCTDEKSLEEMLQCPEKEAALRSKKTVKALEPDEAVFGAAFPLYEASSDRDSLEDLLKNLDEGFPQALLRLIDERGMKDSECYRKANIDRRAFNKIINKPEYRPGKNMVLALAVALRLDLDETRSFVEKAGYSFTHTNCTDVIVEYHIGRREYDVDLINQSLFKYDCQLLGSI